MNLLIPGWKRIDGKNSTLANPSQIPNDRSFPIFSKDDDEIECFKKLGKIKIQGPFSNKEKSHSFLIDGEDLLGIVSLLHQLQNSRISHDDRFGVGEGLPKGFEGSQSKDEIAEGALVNDQDGLDPRCFFQTGRGHRFFSLGQEILSKRFRMCSSSGVIWRIF